MHALSQMRHGDTSSLRARSCATLVCTSAWKNAGGTSSLVLLSYASGIAPSRFWCCGGPSVFRSSL